MHRTTEDAVPGAQPPQRASALARARPVVAFGCSLERNEQLYALRCCVPSSSPSSLLLEGSRRRGRRRKREEEVEKEEERGEDHIVRMPRFIYSRYMPASSQTGHNYGLENLDVDSFCFLEWLQRRGGGDGGGGA